MEKTWVLFIVSLTTFIHVDAVPKQRVCVIGAGRAGLAAIKITADHQDKFEPIAFERNSDVGGLWIYRDDPELDEHGLRAHSGIYKNLRTVTHKNVMTYPDYLTIESTDDNAFLTHDEFLEYMRNYTNHFGLRKYIQLDTLVTKITPVKDSNSCTRNGDKIRWRVKKQNLNRNTTESVVCDAVIVCNGRFSKPNIPKIPGIEGFPGRVLHSRSYRKPEEFTNKTVVVLGAGLSATGIARDLAYDAATVYLSFRQTDITDAYDLEGNVNLVNPVVTADGNKLTLLDKSTIYADAFIFCTGYLYDFPFLDTTSGIIPDDHQLHPLYKNFINKEHRSMAFIGLGTFDVFGHSFYSEAATFLKSLHEQPNLEETLENEVI